VFETEDREEDDGPLLMQCPLFQSLDGDARRQLMSHARRRRFMAGETIFHMGSEGKSMMAVLTGTVRITIPSVQGKQIVLADLHAGETFGELSLLDGGSRSADAVALTNCELAVLHRGDVMPFLRQHPDACLALLGMVSRRLRGADEQMTDILFFDAPLRLAKVIVRRAVPPAHATEGSYARVALSQRELGDLTGVRRERVNRCLQEWQRRGIIQLKEGWIIILKPAVLKEMTELR
jgi:CRP/FNR family transcriptional regulator, cyclic AMP receptor protein